MKKITFAFISSFVFFATQLSAQTFIYKEKTEDSKTSQIHLDFLLGDKSSIKFKEPALLSKFTSSESKISEVEVLPRPVSEAEKAMQAGLWILTAFAALASQETYDLGADMKLVSMRGLLFFIFPFESHYLYRSCKGEDHLVATSVTAEQTLNRLMPLDELHKLCDPEVHEPTRETKS